MIYFSGFVIPRVCPVSKGREVVALAHHLTTPGHVIDLVDDRGVPAKGGIR